MSANLQDQAAWEASARAFFSRQFFQRIHPLPASYDLSGQVALITGSNGGLGFEAARQLLTLRLSHLILAVRSQKKGDAAAEKLRREFPSAQVEVSIVDMASYDSVIGFVKWCEELPRLDIAILNAGLNHDHYELVEGTKHEMVFQVNHISTALLSLLLVPVLRRKRGTTAPARLSIVGSDTAYWASVNPSESQSIFELMDSESTFTPWNAYKRSKLLLLMFINELSQRVSPDEVIINVSNPGACKGTSLGTENQSKAAMALSWILKMLIARSAEEGARQYVDAVTAKGVESHGSFVSDGAIKPFPPIMYEESGKKLQKTIWQETIKELAFADPLKGLEKSN